VCLLLYCQQQQQIRRKQLTDVRAPRNPYFDGVCAITGFCDQQICLKEEEYQFSGYTLDRK